jgi:hypothetical protein
MTRATSREPRDPAEYMRPLALCQPAVRTLLVIVTVDEQGDETTFDATKLPVLAILADRDQDGSPHLEPVVIDDPTWGLVTGTDVECDNTTQRIVVCPWDASEDAERLAPVIRALEAELRRRTERKSTTRRPARPPALATT